MEGSTIFGATDVIHGYSRTQAIEDGVLIDVSTAAREAGIKYPCAVTRAVWHTLVAWSTEDEAAETRASG